MIQKRDKSLYSISMQFNLLPTLHVYLDFHSRMMMCMMEDLVPSLKERKKGDFHATTAGGLNTLYVYTDIIKEQFVGGTSAPLLRIININQKINNEEYTSKTFQRLYFAPLKSSHFDTINIRIYDDTGELINFEYGKVVVYLECQKSPNAI